MANQTGGGFSVLQHFDTGNSNFAFAVQLRQSPQSAACSFGTTTGVSTTITMSPYGARGVAVQTPSAWTAANIGFEVSADNSTWIPLYTATGSQAVISGIGTALASVYAAPAETWALGAYAYMRLTSTTGGTATLQTAARALTVVFLA